MQFKYFDKNIVGESFRTPGHGAEEETKRIGDEIKSKSGKQLRMNLMSKLALNSLWAPDIEKPANH
jgi:hypothetical protein